MLTINIVVAPPEHAPETEVLIAQSTRDSTVRLVVTHKPIESADVLCVPWELLPRWYERPVPRVPPILAYGPAEGLRTAIAAGCVDYLRTPWTYTECVVRAELAAHRYLRLDLSGCVRLDGGHIVRVNPGSNEPAAELALTFVEERIVRALLSRRGAPVTREELRVAVGGEADSRALDVHIHAIRAKLARVVQKQTEPSAIRTVYGIGYVLD